MINNEINSLNIRNKPVEQKSKPSQIKKSDSTNNIPNSKKMDIQQKISSQLEKAAGKEEQKDENQGISSYIKQEAENNFNEYTLSKSEKIPKKYKQAKKLVKNVKNRGIKESIEELKNNSSTLKKKIKNIQIKNPFKNGFKQGIKNIGTEIVSNIKESGELETLRLIKNGAKKLTSKQGIKNIVQNASKGIKSVKSQSIGKIASSTAKTSLRGISRAAGPIVAVAAAGIDYKSRLEEGKTHTRAAIETTVSTGASILGAAAAGAALGSVVPGVGTVVGAVIGGALAAFATDKIMDKVLGNWGRSR